MEEGTENEPTLTRPSLIILLKPPSKLYAAYPAAAIPTTAPGRAMDRGSMPPDVFTSGKEGNGMDEGKEGPDKLGAENEGRERNWRSCHVP